VYAETRFQALSTEAANGGVLREPQLRVVKGEADPLRQAYLIHRTLSTAIETLESDWSSRADGRSPSATHVGYADAMALLADKSVAPDERYTDRPSDAANEYLECRSGCARRASDAPCSPRHACLTRSAASNRGCR
jgi:hypothetical protein